MSAESQLAALGINLPAAPKPGGVYAPALIVGDMIHVSGHVPWLEGGGFIQGKVGLEVGPEVGVEAARRTGLYVLATLKKYLGSLDKWVMLVFNPTCNLNFILTRDHLIAKYSIKSMLRSDIASMQSWFDRKFYQKVVVFKDTL